MATTETTSPIEPSGGLLSSVTSPVLDAEPEISEAKAKKPVRNKTRTKWPGLNGRPSNADRRKRAEEEAARRAEELREAAQAVADATAEQVDEEEDLDDPEPGPTSRRRPDEFKLAQRQGTSVGWFEWLSQTTTPQDWEGSLMLYLWRTGPMTDRRAIGKATHVCKYVELIDIDRVMMDHGSGDYRLDFCVLTQPNSKVYRRSQHQFGIFNPKFPPKIPAGEWLDDPANANWQWARPLLEAEAASIKTAAAAGVTPMGIDPSQMLATVASTFKSLQPPPADNSLANTLLTLLLKREDTPRGPDPVLAMLSEQLKESREETRELRKMVLENKGKSFFEQFKEMKQLSDLINPRNNNRAHWTDRIADIAEKIVEQAPAALSAMHSGQRPQPTVTTTATATTAAQPAAVSATPAATDSGIGMTAEQEQRIQALYNKHKETIEGSAWMMRDCFTNKTGYDFRDFFIDRYTKEVWLEFKSAITAPQLAELISANEWMKAAMTPPALVVEYFEAFFCNPGEEPSSAFEPETPETETPKKEEL